MSTPIVARGRLIEARDIVKSFGQTPALRGASATVVQGEILAVMGPSGSGKSTLLHCLAGIFTPDRGGVWFDGQRLGTLGEAERTRLRRTAFGFVFQFGQLVPELTAADNVALPLLLNRTSRKAAYKTAETWLDRPSPWVPAVGRGPDSAAWRAPRRRRRTMALIAGCPVMVLVSSRSRRRTVARSSEAVSDARW